MYLRALLFDLAEQASFPVFSSFCGLETHSYGNDRHLPVQYVCLFNHSGHSSLKILCAYFIASQP